VNVGGLVTLPSGEQITLNADMTATVLTDGDLGTTNFTYSTVDTAGNPTTGYATIGTTTTPPDFIVKGTAGNDLIDATLYPRSRMRPDRQHRPFRRDEQ
jgi:hypothetical protein